MKYKVELNSCGNPDRGQDPFSNVFGAYARVVRVNSIEEAQAVVREYIDEHNLGGGNWSGGSVWTEGGEYVGRISYNGRFWDKNSEYGKEVK